MNRASMLVTPGREIKQARGRKTYDALIVTGFKLLEHRELEDISIAELARVAGYSVGAFYARFRSKNEFYDALIAHHLHYRTKARNRIFATAPSATLVEALIRDLVSYYWRRRRFWRAALMRTMRDPEFWEPIRAHGHEFAHSLLARIRAEAKRDLTATEQTNVHFAIQVALAAINNAIINQPGPIMLGQEKFLGNLVRTFRLVSDYDRLVGLTPPR